MSGRTQMRKICQIYHKNAHTHGDLCSLVHFFLGRGCFNVLEENPNLAVVVVALQIIPLSNVLSLAGPEWLSRYVVPKGARGLYEELAL